jgi:hypothetical protein
MTKERVETAALLAALFVLVAVEFYFVQWLPDLPSGERLNTLELLTMPPWYKNPRLEASMLAAVSSGFIVSSAWAIGQARWSRQVPSCATNAMAIARRRLVVAVVFAFLTGVDFALNAPAQ